MQGNRTGIECSVSTVVAIERMQRNLKRLLKGVLAEAKINYTEMAILSVLKASLPYSLYVRELKDATMTQFDIATLEELAAQRLIKEDETKASERNRYFIIQPKGIALLDKITKEFRSNLVADWNLYIDNHSDPMGDEDLLLYAFSRFRQLNPRHVDLRKFVNGTH